MKIVKLFLLFSMIMSFKSLAQVTLPLVDEKETSKGTLCIYENSQQTETYFVAKGYQCPSVKTFK